MSKQKFRINFNNITDTLDPYDHMGNLTYFGIDKARYIDPNISYIHIYIYPN